MAMTVVLVFDDDEQALTLIDDMLEAKKHGRHGILTPLQENDVHPVVKGLYKHPTMFCICQSGRKTELGFTRGKKWGWWVCAQCSMPKALYWKNIFNANGFGNNLLDRYFEREDESLKA